MIRTAKVIFCENEHGTGDVTFPNLDMMSTVELQQEYIGQRTARQLRQEAKKAGWGRVDGGDYCPSCVVPEQLGQYLKSRDTEGGV